MRSILHILTRPDDTLARDIITRQEEGLNNKIAIADLAQPLPDYRDLLRKIFDADSIQSW